MTVPEHLSPPLGQPRFSVVLPAFNEADYLGATLASLQQQDFTDPYEVIVVDNNSTDATAAIASRYGVRVVAENTPGVCAARQRGTAAATGEIVVSTDADTIHPRNWLTQLDGQFRRHPHAIAVAGACRYAEPPWWAAVFPPLWFAAVAVVSAVAGRVFYITATNIAFVRSGFPGYDTTLTQGGDEVDLLRRLRSRGQIVWDPRNTVTTSSRRLDQGLAYTLVVSYGYHYALSYLLNRVSQRTVIGAAPAIRRADAERVRRRRLRWRAVAAASVLSAAGAARTRVRGG